MDANKPTNEYGNHRMLLKHQRGTSEKGGPHFGQLYYGRKILASKYQHHARTTILSSSVCTENTKHNIRDVHLKDSIGMVVRRGIVESQLHTRDNVEGLILFYHQVAVRLMEVYACKVHKSNEDGQVL